MAKTKIKFFCSLQKKEIKKQGRWSQEEQDRFLKGCYFFKNDWEKIKDYIKTRTIPQIRSHAQKYLIKICRKYSIKLSKKKFSNRLSKHLDITKMPYKGKTNISNMSIYEKNILEMFNYYKREIMQDDKILLDNNNNEFNNLNSRFGEFNNSNNINMNHNDINFSNLNNTSQLEIMHNLAEKDIKKENIFDINEKLKDLKKNNNFLLTFNNFNYLSNSFSYKNYDILSDLQNNDTKKINSLPNLLQSSFQNLNNTPYINSQTKQLLDLNCDIPFNSVNNFNQNKFFIQNEYEFYLMQKISYYNSLLLNSIKSNQKLNENILIYLGFNPKENINNINNTVNKDKSEENLNENNNNINVQNNNLNHII